MVSEPRKILVELGKHLCREFSGNQAVWTFQCGFANPFGLSSVDITVHRWLLSTRTAKPNAVVIESNHENWVDPIPSSIEIHPPQELLGGPVAVVGHDNLQGAISLPDVVSEVVV